MKTLITYIIQFSVFYTCTCIQLQPRPNEDYLNKLSYSLMNILNKCNGVNRDFIKNSFLDQDTVLCFGINVLHQQYSWDTEDLSSVFDGAEKKYFSDICEHIQEMVLDSAMEKSNESVAVYNRQFLNKNTCERACVDVMENVNPLCSLILLANRHLKGNHSRSDAQVSSTPLPVDKADNDDNDVSRMNLAPEKSRKVDKDFSNSIPVEQKPKASIKEGVMGNQETKTITQEQISEREKVGLKSDENKSNVQKIEITHPDQRSQAVGPAVTNVEVKLPQGQTQQTDETEIVSDKEKPKVTSEGKTLLKDTANEKPASIVLQEGKVPTSANINTGTDASKITTNSKKEAEGTAGEDKKLETKNESQRKSDTVMGENIQAHSVAGVPDSSSGNKIEQETATGLKSQGTFSAGKDSLSSKNEVADAGLQQVINVEQGREIENDQKSQVNNKETENPPQKEVDLQMSSKKMTEEIPKSNIDEQKTNQNSGKAYTKENFETAPPSGRSDTQKTLSEEMQFTDDTGDGVPELDTHFSVEAGESNDNTEFTSGGGTGVDYARPGSDVLETGKSVVDGGTLLIHEKYEDDDSHFFAYFMTTMVFCIVGYLLFHNKQKILALALEGRARRGRRRPNTSGYRKLDSNLEEAISSSKSASVTQVIY